MSLFGAIYYILPRLTGVEWSSARLIRTHLGFGAGHHAVFPRRADDRRMVSGLMMNNPNVQFIDIVKFTVPFLWSRSLAGTLMTVGHIALAILVWRMLRETWSAPHRRARPPGITPAGGGRRLRC